MPLARVYHQGVFVWVFTHPFETSVKSDAFADRNNEITFTMKDK